MAGLLDRLGRACAKRAWAVLSVWAVLLGLAGTGFGLWHQDLVTSFEIPGMPSSEVVEELAREMPEYAGASGTIVYRNSDGRPLTAAQRQQITALCGKLAGLEDVAQVVDPFAVEQQRTDAQTQIQQGQAQIDAGLVELDNQQALLTAQADQLAAQAAMPLPDDLMAQVLAAQAQLATGQQQLDDQRAQIQAQQLAIDQGRELARLAEPIRVVSTDSTTAVVTISFTVPRLELPTASKQAVIDAVEANPIPGTEVGMSVEIAQAVPQVVGFKEVIGLLVALIVLGVLLRALVATVLPLVTALTGVGVGVLSCLACSGVIQMAVVTPVLGVMLGLAVGIDYSLFILNRHRRQLLAGVELNESIGLADGTSGTAVVFAGSTVVVALLALNVVGIPFLSVMGNIGAICVAIAVLVAITAIPALLGLVRERVLSRKERALLAEGGYGTERTATTHQPMTWRRAIITAAITIPALLLIAVPALDMRVGLPGGDSEPAGSYARIGFAITEQQFGDGANTPLLVVANLPTDLDSTAIPAKQLTIAQAIADVEGVAAVAPIGISPDQTLIAYQVLPETGPNDAMTEQVVHALRALPPINGDTTIAVAGQTAINIDISDRLQQVLPIYLALVVGLSLLIMILVFRSLLVPLIATGGFVASLLATYGALVAVFQWGWLGWLFGLDSPGPILNFLPIILVGILFGLAMDYQLFLSTGMREAYAHGVDARTAVNVGWRAGRSVVIAAGLIMVAVFSGFIFSESTIVRPLGFGLAVGILFDAFVVRLLLMPACMHIVGKAAWWLPGWLDRLLPNIDIEGAELERAHHLTHLV